MDQLHPPIKGFQGLKPYNDEQEARLQEDVQVKVDAGARHRLCARWVVLWRSSVANGSADSQQGAVSCTNRCMRCGGEGHWAKDRVAAATAFVGEKKQEGKVEKKEEKKEEEKKEKKKEKTKPKTTVKRQRKNKNPKVVVAEKSIKCSIISMMLTDAGRRKRKRCYDDDDDNKKNGAKVGGEKAAAAETVCSRCGRNSHTVAHCYAKTHFNGTPLLLREGKDDGKVEEEKKEKEENMPKKKDGGGSGNGDVGKSSGGSSSSSRVIKSKYFSAAQGSALNSGTQQRPFSSLELLRMYRSATY